MDLMDFPINKQEQYKKIIEDTEEIIKNFREFSGLIVSQLEKSESSMYKLGRNLIQEKSQTEDKSLPFGTKPVKFLT